MAEVFKVHALDRIQQQRTWSRSLIFKLAEVFQIFSQARDQVVDIPVMAQTQVPMVRFTIEILQLVDVCCAGPASSCAVVGDSRDPTVAALFILDSCCMPVVCNDKCPWSMTSRSSSTVMDVPAICSDGCTVAVPPIQFIARVRGQSVVQRGWYSTFSSGGYGGDEVVF